MSAPPTDTEATAPHSATADATDFLSSLKEVAKAAHFPVALPPPVVASPPPGIEEHPPLATDAMDDDATADASPRRDRRSRSRTTEEETASFDLAQRTNEIMSSYKDYIADIQSELVEGASPGRGLLPGALASQCGAASAAARVVVVYLSPVPTPPSFWRSPECYVN